VERGKRRGDERGYAVVYNDEEKTKRR